MSETDLPGPEIRTTTVGSYSQLDWLASARGEQAVVDATTVVIAAQRRAGIDLPTDGELYRYDPDHPDTNGMIEWFTSQLGGIDPRVTRSDVARFRALGHMGFRVRPAAVVRGPIGEGSLDLEAACTRSAAVAGGPFKFTLTSPYMLARTLLDDHYDGLEARTMAIAEALAAQVAALPCAVLQIDEANIPGSPEHAPIAQAAINRILQAFPGRGAVHFCFGNYGGQTIQAGGWQPLVAFLDGLQADHLVLELAHRPDSDLEALAAIRDDLVLGVGVIDIKVNHVEGADEVARRIEAVVARVGRARLGWVHPDCGFWMLKRSVAERKLAALVAGRDRFLGL